MAACLDCGGTECICGFKRRIRELEAIEREGLKGSPAFAAARRLAEACECETGYTKDDGDDLPKWICGICGAGDCHLDDCPVRAFRAADGGGE